MKVLVVGIVLAAVVASPFPSPSADAAAVFVVDAPTDAEDANPGDGACLTLAGECTLRAAVQEANATAGLDTVSLPAGTFTLSLGGVDEDASMTGDIDVVDDLAVVGAGPDSTVVDAAGIDRIFHIVGADLEVTLKNLTLTGGVRGAILSEGNLEIANVVAHGNVGGSFSGIVENAGGTLVVSDSAIIDNEPGFGAIQSHFGNLEVVRTLIARNGAIISTTGGIDAYENVSVIRDSLITDNGWGPDGVGGSRHGGVSNRGPSLMFITGSTISGNYGTFVGGILNATGQPMAGPIVDHGLVVVNTTIAYNAVGSGDTSQGGGIYNERGPLWVSNTTISGNTAPIGGGISKALGAFVNIDNSIIWGNVAADGPDCFGTLTSHDYNIIGESADCTLSGSATHDLIGTDPLLGALGDNGGYTPTMSLLQESPAIDAGNPEMPGSVEFSCADTDQRGIKRPQAAQCDVGAYEVVRSPVEPPPTASDSFGLVDPSSGVWHLYVDDQQTTQFYFGNPGDYPFMGDWDCDGTDTPGLFRQSDGYVYLRNSNTVGIADVSFFFGNPGDVPIAGDFNDDGCDTVSIYRPSNQMFYIINKLGTADGGLGAAEYSFLFGDPGDKPVVGDWDGDGIDEIGLHRETTGFLYYRNTLTTGIADGQFFFGDPGDRFVAGDWGVVDGVETPAVFRPSNLTFYFRHTLTQGNADSQFVWNGAGSNWLPVSGDFALD